MTPTATNSPDDRTYLVYKAVSPSGKVYVGITSQTLDTRVLWHFRAARVSKSRGRRNYFHNALRKYGDKIQWEILERVVGMRAANERERHFITVFQSNEPTKGYNGTDGGDANAQPNAAVRQKMSASAKARGTSPSQLQNLVFGRVSRLHTQETKDKLAAIRTGWTPSRDTRKKMSRAHSGKTHSEEHCQSKRLSQANPVLRFDGRPFLSARQASQEMGAHSEDAVGRSICRGTSCGGFTFKRIGPGEYEAALEAWAHKLAAGHVEQRPMWTNSREGYRHTGEAKKNMSTAWHRRGGRSVEHETHRLRSISKPVYRSDGEVFPSILSAAEAHGLTPAQISYSIRKGTPRTGFTFSSTALVSGNVA